ncbi:hypothetical protein EPUS_09088 [Endocarpon pusillum Z07020]|uniref:Uncharacterized protein n=1 Tax=Endocarpon pusillum (strain Z07020 / HMAS-L-300199) TaxID=1263415 RepID=U1GFU3_ENDPU|nr:uncharacterized protein EPUS_09088 [Endocarpon pusillum Z07020]ERF70983.1 hypothetical protein EPUS_09088 [Endocarpon pusillum Z07020]
MTFSSASPAPAILASSLLSREKNRRPHSPHQWRTGIPSLDRTFPPHRWIGGKLIGMIDESTASILVEEPKLPLITQLIITHLASIHECSINISTSPPSSSPPPEAPAAAAAAAPATVFMITSATACSTSSISPTTLATALESAHLPASLLDTVSLLQYFDFPGLADAVAEVSSTLSQRQHDGQAQNKEQQPHHPPSDSTSAQTQPQPAQPSIVVLEGLTQTLTTLARSTGPVATNAFLVPLLRSLTQLSRTRPDLLIVMLLEVEFLDLFSSLQGDSGAAEELSAFAGYF